MKRPTFLSLLIVALVCHASSSIQAQTGQIRITISDKEGNPHIRRNVIYNITGVSIDESGVEIPLLSGVPAIDRLVTSNPAGQIIIPLPIRELRDPRVKETLNDSKQITVHLFPQSKDNEPDLANVDVDLLLGDRPQDMHIVVMTRREYEAAAGDELAAAYESPRGRFHLLGDVGTALYRGTNGHWILVELAKETEDERYIYYREVGMRNRLWAFSRGTVYYPSRRCGCCWVCSYRKSVWFADTANVAKWRLYTYASRIDANRDE